MHILVGELPYSIVLVRGYVVDAGPPARNCLGLADFDTQTIYVSDVPDPVGRLQTLIHEIMEAWFHHVGQPADKETLCDLIATAMTQPMLAALKQPATLIRRLSGRGSAVETLAPARARQFDLPGARVTVLEPVM